MRGATWVFLGAVAFVLLGVASLFLTSFVVGSVAPTAARQVVLAVHSAVWTVAGASATIGIGGLMVSQTVRPRPTVMCLIAAVVASTAAAAIAADPMSATSAVEIDQIGLAVWVPGLVGAIAVSDLAAASVPTSMRRPWLVTELAVSAATGALAGLGALSVREPANALGLVLAVAVAVAAIVLSLRGLMRVRSLGPST